MRVLVATSLLALLNVSAASAQSRERVEPKNARTTPPGPLTKTGTWTGVTVEGTRGFFVTRRRGGPSQDRLDLAFVAEGYTSSERSEFVSHCERVMTLFEDRAPYSDYRKLINVHYIFFPSATSGIGRAKPKGTVFGAHFNENWSLKTGISADRAKIQRYVTAALPADCEADRIAVVCNDWKHGGTSWGKISFSTRKGFWANIPLIAPDPPLEDTVAHELGHSIGALADEYTGGGRDYDHEKVLSTLRTWPKPNVTTFDPLPKYSVPWKDFDKQARVPWAHWIEAESKVPSGGAFGWFGADVGLYKGALYSSDYAYRPSSSCTMKSSGKAAFCAPCQEALILRFHAFSRHTTFESVVEGEELVLSYRCALPRWRHQSRSQSRFPDELWSRITWTWIQERGKTVGAELRLPLELLPEEPLVLELDVWNSDPAVRKHAATLQGAEFVLTRPTARTARGEGLRGGLQRR